MRRRTLAVEVVCELGVYYLYCKSSTYCVVIVIVVVED